MRVQIEEPSSGRFQVSDTDIPIDFDNLLSLKNFEDHYRANGQSGFTVEGVSHENGDESFTYQVTFDPFSIR